MVIPLVPRLVFALLFSGCLLQDAPAGYRMWFASEWERFKDQDRESRIFVVDDGKLRVEFVRGTYWTIGRIFYRGFLIGSASGGTGSVVHWDGRPVGSVHRDGEVSEKLISVELTVDGKTISLHADGQESGSVTYLEGGSVELVKKSRIGPFLHQARFTFPEGSGEVLVKNDYEAVEAVTPERFAGYRYVFMHMMPLDMTEWLSVEPDGRILSGTTKGMEPEALKILWTRAIRGFASYSPAHQVGVCYSYPVVYPGVSHFGYRGGKDTKFRSILFDRDEYAAGEKLSWSITMIPFAATPNDWAEEAVKLMQSNND